MLQEKAESDFYERSLEQHAIDDAKDCILEKEGFGVWDDFKSFFIDPKLKVITEKTILGNDRRMDIYLSLIHISEPTRH